MHVVSLRELDAGRPTASRSLHVGDGAAHRSRSRRSTDREDVARLISKYNLLAVPVVDDGGHVLGIVTVDDVIDAIVREQTEDVQKFGGMEALDEPYMEIGFWRMIRKRAGWLCALFLGEMLTATAMGHFEGEIAKAVVLALFIPLIISSGGNSGSQATSLIIRALALRELTLERLVAGRACASCRPASRSARSSARSASIRIVLWQQLRLVRLRRALAAGRAHGRRWRSSAS